MITVKKLRLGLSLSVLALLSAFSFVISLPKPVHASSMVCKCTNTYSDGTVKEENGASVTIFGDENGCYCGGTDGAINLIVSIFTGTVVVAGTVGIVIVGLMFLTARDNEEQVAKAKKRLAQVVVGIIAFALIDAIANLLVPGGLANRKPLVASSESRLEEAEDPELELAEEKTRPSGLPPTMHTYDNEGQSSSSTGCLDGAKKTSSVKFYWQFNKDVGNIIWKGGTCQGSSKNWKPNSKIGASGCPMMASLNAINKVTGCGYTPKMFAEHMKKYTNNFKDRKGLFSNNSCWSNTGAPIVKHYMKAYKVHYKEYSGSKQQKKEKAKEALLKQHVVIVSGKGDDIFGTNAGHFVLFSTYKSSSNTVTIINPSQGGLRIDKNLDTAVKHAKRFIEVWN